MRENNCCPRCRRIPGVCGSKWICTCHRDRGAWTDPGMTGTALGYDARITAHRTRVQERKA